MSMPRSAFCRERGAKMEHARLIDGAASDPESGKSSPSGTWADVYALPPLPDQDLCAMRGEACCGNSLVLFLIFLFVAPMQAYVAQSSGPITVMVYIWMAAIYAEAATAIICLIGLMWGDPGTVKRTPENCFPLPEVVAERLRNGRSLDGVGNVTEVRTSLAWPRLRACKARAARGHAGVRLAAPPAHARPLSAHPSRRRAAAAAPSQDGRVFCIRCLVWRPDDTETHHCATCQRCVVEFDHHCGGAYRPATSRIAAQHIAPQRTPSEGTAREALAQHVRPHARLRVPRACVRSLRPLHRGRRLRRQHGLLQDAHHDGLPRLRHLRLLHVRLGERRCARHPPRDTHTVTPPGAPLTMIYVTRTRPCHLTRHTLPARPS
jgi:hypothetical protein